MSATETNAAIQVDRDQLLEMAIVVEAASDYLYDLLGMIPRRPAWPRLSGRLLGARQPEGKARVAPG